MWVRVCVYVDQCTVGATMTRLHRGVGLLGVIVLGLVAGIFPAVPAANAAVAPWTWKRVVQNFNVGALTSDAIRALCPVNYTAVTGGLQVPLLASVRPQGQYRFDDGLGLAGHLPQLLRLNRERQRGRRVR